MERKVNYHALKIAPKYYKAQKDHTKKFEIRKNDRDYHVGDILFLHEWKDGKETESPPLVREITYIITAKEFPDGLKPNYCILGTD